MGRKNPGLLISERLDIQTSIGSLDCRMSVVLVLVNSPTRRPAWLNRFFTSVLTSREIEI